MEYLFHFLKFLAIFAGIIAVALFLMQFVSAATV
ncbi:MAG: hypothetical protein AB199_00025 [Parcubacteria bacterium C7867-004]|nr:MAG: hypothetical protein AB199_00025 [Parcubacteria bacterium C7867-004]